MNKTHSLLQKSSYVGGELMSWLIVGHGGEKWVSKDCFFCVSVRRGLRK